MAKIKQGILGGFSGKVANVVGTSWKGRAVMKSQPLSVANPKTEAQQEQRGKFSKIAELASVILTQFVQPVENPISGDISGYNLFCKDNKGAFDALGDIVAANCVCGGGKIVNLDQSSVAIVDGGDNLDAVWVNQEDLSAVRLTDKVYMAIVAEEKDYIFANNGANARSEEATSNVKVKGADNFANGDKVVVFYACVSADGRDVSIKTTAKEITLSL